LKLATQVRNTFTHSIIQRQKEEKEKQRKAKNSVTMSYITNHMGSKSNINIFLINYVLYFV